MYTYIYIYKALIPFPPIMSYESLKPLATFIYLLFIIF